MRTTLAVKTDPTTEPVTVQQAMAHCRIDNAGEQDIVQGFIRSARIMAEGYLSRVLMPQTLTWTIRPERNEWAIDTRLRRQLILPRAPVTAINSVTVTDTFGNATVIPAAVLPASQNTPLLGYIADLTLEPSTIYIGGATVLTDGRELSFTLLRHIQVEFVAGYTDATTVPQPILDAIKMLTAYLYENRGDVATEMPRSAEWLLDRYRMSWID